MNIELSEEQYEKLLKTAFLGNWVINATKDPEDRKQDFEDLFTMLVQQGEGEEDANPLETYQNNIEIQEYLADYSEDVFWEELIERLAKRDIIEILGEQIEKIDEETLDTLGDGIALKYLSEFEENGVDTISVQNVNLDEFTMEPSSSSSD